VDWALSQSYLGVVLLLWTSIAAENAAKSLKCLLLCTGSELCGFISDRPSATFQLSTSVFDPGWYFYSMLPTLEPRLMLDSRLVSNTAIVLEMCNAWRVAFMTTFAACDAGCEN